MPNDGTPEENAVEFGRRSADAQLAVVSHQLGELRGVIEQGLRRMDEHIAELTHRVGELEAWRIGSEAEDRVEQRLREEQADAANARTTVKLSRGQTAAAWLAGVGAIGYLAAVLAHAT